MLLFTWFVKCQQIGERVWNKFQERTVTFSKFKCLVLSDRHFII